MWRTVACARGGFVAVVLGLSLGLTQNVSALDSMVVTQVCQPDAGGSLVIATPPSDTVVRVADITIEGVVEQVSQVEVYVDEAFYKIVAIAVGQTAYSIPLTLTPGTHTVELRGNSICTADIYSDEVVVTYEPPPAPVTPTEPSIGSETPTVINPTPQRGGGVVVSNPNPTNDPSSNSSGQAWWNLFVGWLGVQGFLGWTLELTDVNATAQRWAVDGWRVLVFVVGLLLLVCGGWLAGWMISRWKFLTTVGRRHLGVVWRLFGGLLIFASLLLML